jgi:hypothetical protein
MDHVLVIGSANAVCLAGFVDFIGTGSRRNQALFDKRQKLIDNQ